ncbi:MAG: CHAT domain-containing protein, partial [Candidatus Omnitrophica bacterium]|nr:CHAT domain-containing protein [Candidatus Omnitrophota bacterium]
MQETQPLVLEILKQGSGLSMSLFEQRELASTVRHYHQMEVSFPEINRLCQENIFLLNKSSLERFKKVSRLLWEHLFTRQVKEKLKRSHSGALIISLDEELINIPWEFLYDGEDFLCLKYALGRLIRASSNTESPPQYRALNSTLKMLILANPTNDLNSAYAEGKFIRDHFDHRRKQVKINFKSTQIESLYVKKNLRDYDIVHFAGHAEHNQDDPRESGWVLSDGKFSAQDIRVLGEAFSLPHLIFSNACQCAPIEGAAPEHDYQHKTYNLASAFLFSGVKHYIGCAWKIEDKVSLNFAKEFYSLLIEGESIGECVRRSRLKLIAEFGSGINFWASHLLYGDPNFALFAKPNNIRKNLFSIPKIASKPQFRTALAGLFLISFALLYVFLPTRNPQAFLDFLRARHFLSNGENAQAALFSKEIIRNDSGFLNSYFLLAEAYQRMGDRPSALKTYFACLLEAQKKRSVKDTNRAYTAIAWEYHLSGEYAKAFDFYQRALESSMKNRDLLHQAVAMRKLAVWYIDNEEYDKALELLTKSSEINRERQHIFAHRYNLACDNFDLGLVFSDKGDLPTAAEFYRKAKLLFEKLKLKDELSDFYFNQGEIFLFEKEYQKALEYYLKGLAIDRQKNDFPAIAVDYD